jgi:hypothetical protein
MILPIASFCVKCVSISAAVTHRAALFNESSHWFSEISLHTATQLF